MSRQTGWEKIDSDLWRLRESRDQAIVIAKVGGWAGLVDIRDTGVKVMAEKFFPLTNKGREEAKGWVEKVWAVLGKGER